jgi:RNA polymerase sigma factor (sigma-70 family)
VALGQLPARERVVLGMVHLDGKSQREVAEILGLSKGYVSKLLARATARLEEELRD